MTLYILRDLRGNQKIKHDTLYPQRPKGKLEDKT